MRFLLLILTFISFTSYIQAQQAYVSASDNPVKVSVKGSSTLHDWEAVASEISEYPTSVTTDLSSSSAFENFGFKVTVKSLDGGRGASMNKKIRKALHSTEQPYIIYKSTHVTLELVDEGQVLKSKGIVSIAGKEMEIEVDASVKVVDTTLIISGSKALKMGDFNIEPPTAMFGQIKTRDDITVHFEFRYIAE